MDYAKAAYLGLNALRAGPIRISEISWTGRIQHLISLIGEPASGLRGNGEAHSVCPNSEADLDQPPRVLRKSTYSYPTKRAVCYIGFTRNGEPHDESKGSP